MSACRSRRWRNRLLVNDFPVMGADRVEGPFDLRPCRLGSDLPDRDSGGGALVPTWHHIGQSSVGGMMFAITPFIRCWCANLR